MVLKQAELARRLGVDRSAISRAIERGKLETLPDGKLDTESTLNRAYLAKWSAHRGKARSMAPMTPGRAEAMLRRARAAYGKGLARFRRRKSALMPADILWQSLEDTFAGIQDALRGFADAVDLDSPTLEMELQSCMKTVLESRRQTELPPQDPDAPPPIDLPDDPGADLDTVRARLDDLAAAGHHLSAAEEDGEAVSQDYARRTMGALVHDYLNGGLLLFPRRTVAALAAVLATSGADAARTWLRDRVAEEVLRLERPLDEIRGHLEAVCT